MSEEPLGRLPKNSAKPLYQQIKEAIEQRVHSGQWAEGQKVPSENALVEELQVSRMTINRALRELTQDGLLKRVHGLGTFVAERPRHASLIALRHIAEEIRQQGRSHSCRVLRLESVAADDRVAARMGIDEGSALFHLEALHCQDGVPIQYENRFVCASSVPEFIQQDFSRITSTEYLVGCFRPDEMEHTVQAVLPSEEQAHWLDIAQTEPCICLRRRTWVDGQVLTAVDLLYPGSRYDLHARYAVNDFQLKSGKD